MAATRPGAASAIGFTLLELVITIAIMGIIAAVIVVFLLKPVQGYFDTTRRARLVDTAEFALKRIARDLAIALPNSVRSDVTKQFIEMLQMRSGGRYCNAADCGDPLLDANNTFTVIGPAVSVASGDSVVIGNLPTSCDAYAAASANRRALVFTATPTTTIQFTGVAFSGSCAEITKRFQIVSGAVTYACESATSTLWRYSGYAIQAAQPASIAALDGLAGVVKTRLATNVNCPGGGGNMGTVLDAPAIGEALVELRIQIQDSTGESVNLYRPVHVDNTP